MKILKRILLVVFVLLGILVYFNYPKLNIISGYAAKNMASSVFIAARTPYSIKSNDNDMPLIKLAGTQVDNEGKYATASVFGLMERKAVYREGLGCVLVNGEYDPTKKTPRPKRTYHENGHTFPYGGNVAEDTLFPNVDYQKLQYAVEKSFLDPELKKTRTVLVVHKDHIIAEKYIRGFDETTPILGWSMTKSVLATLYGILEYQGKLDVNTAPSIKEWENDGRSKIKLDHLLRMQSGLEWEEDYSKISDVTKMLFLESDMGQSQLHKKMVALPTEIWNYSSGTSNLLSGHLHRYFPAKQDYMDFPYTALIDRIGMTSMLLETDLEGNYVGSSYAWANTRDWAKFGLLYLKRGNWNGERLFSPEWVDYVTRPTIGSNGTYGAHFWLNAEGKFPDVPRDMFSANGFQGQHVFIIPSKDLVVVRTGLSEDPAFDINEFLSDIIAAIR
ncbi:MAG: serine hydrolase [Sediminicola sp.]